MISKGVEKLGQGRFRSIVVDICRNCLGKGMIRPDGESAFSKCFVCKGSGKVEVTKEIQVTVKPY